MTFDQIHRAANRSFSAWKNGGGETAEIAAFPSGAGFDDFGWRISTAIVARSGAFSCFPGCHRILTVIEGGALLLRINGTETKLDPSSPPHAFAGDAPCDCTLTGAPVLDLNVMTRAPWRATVQRGTTAPVDTPDPAAPHFIFALQDLPELDLNRHDLARLSAPIPALDQTQAILVTLHKLAASSLPKYSSAHPPA